MSQTLHCFKQLRLLLIKDVNALRAKLAAEPLEGVRTKRRGQTDEEAAEVAGRGGGEEAEEAEEAGSDLVSGFFTGVLG